MMIRLLFVFILSIFGSCSSAPEEPEYAVITYDSGEFLRIVSPRSGDLVRWSENPEQNGLKTWIIRDKDSLRIYRNLLKKTIIDSSVRIMPAVSTVRIGEMDFVDHSYTNDVHADAMIVFHYEDSARGCDSIFISSTHINPIRYNGFRATADSLCWEAVTNRITEFRQK